MFLIVSGEPVLHLVHVDCMIHRVCVLLFRSNTCNFIQNWLCCTGQFIGTTRRPLVNVILKMHSINIQVNFHDQSSRCVDKSVVLLLKQTWEQYLITVLFVVYMFLVNTKCSFLLFIPSTYPSLTEFYVCLYQYLSFSE